MTADRQIHNKPPVALRVEKAFAERKNAAEKFFIYLFGLKSLCARKLRLATTFFDAPQHLKGILPEPWLQPF
jgi:hypothetical protein